MDIKASDLRIGNLFIGYNGLEFEWGLFHFELMKRGIEIDEIIHKGVPLTEELLLSFGSCKINDDVFIYNRFQLICQPNYKYWYVVDVNDYTYLTKIEFVHEFQNFIYVMNGDEVELKNPPVKD